MNYAPWNGCSTKNEGGTSPDPGCNGAMAKKLVCPHCGNRNQRLFEDNGVNPTHIGYGILCIARVKPEDWAFADPPDPDQLDAEGLVVCGWQWYPNDG